jgi:transcriptional regulator with XRE-family HTH domain
MPATDDICIALRSWRIRTRLRQDAVARSLGVAQSQVSRWESGRDRPRPHNVEAIRRLIWGVAADPFTALRQFVTQSSPGLVLFDASQRVLARSRPFQVSPNPLDRHGWAIDPGRNPGYAALHRRYCDVMARPGGVVSMTVLVPFQDNGNPWSARIVQTIHATGDMTVALAELSFDPAPADLGNARLEEVRIDEGGGTRTSLTIWR